MTAASKLHSYCSEISFAIVKAFSKKQAASSRRAAGSDAREDIDSEQRPSAKSHDFYRE
jgi:hypothetical protein